MKAQIQEVRKRKEPEIPEENTPTLEAEGKLYEQVRSGQYLYTNDGSVHVTNEVIHEGTKYLPCGGEEVEKGVVLLPTGTEEYGTPQQLIEDIRAHIKKYLDITDEYSHLASWYVLLTYVHDRVTTLNYLSALGDTGTGKSRYLDVLGRICYRPVIASGAVTIAALKRVHRKWRGTLVVDEADFKESDEKNELIKFFNLGFERQRTMFSCDKNDPSQIDFFIPYGPKIIARRRQFYDAALEARCLTHTMQQTSRKDIPRVLTRSFYEAEQVLRNKLLKFRFEYYDQIDEESSAMMDMGDVEPRIEQATRAFIPLMKSVPGALEDFKKFLKVYNADLIDERASTNDGVIVNAIVDLLLGGTEHISASTLKPLCEQEGMTKTSARSIGRRLAALGLKCQLRRVDGKVMKVVPIGERLVTVSTRYISDAERLKELVTCVTNIRNAKSESGNIKGNHETLVTMYGDSLVGSADVSYNFSQVSIYDVTKRCNVTPDMKIVSIKHMTDNKKDAIGTTDSEVIHHKCWVCKSAQSTGWSRTGKPLCKDCNEQFGGKI